MDSSESPTYGEQEGSAYNGHFSCTCYHPLFVFNQLGDLERSDPPPVWWTPMLGFRARRTVSDECDPPDISRRVQARGG